MPLWLSSSMTLLLAWLELFLNSDCQTKVNRGLTSLRCPRCGTVNATEVARYRSEILAYEMFVLSSRVSALITTILRVKVSDYKFTAIRQTITVTKIVSITLLPPLPQAVEIPVMQVMMVTRFLGQV
ncbi:hypothetical protein Bca101_009385 [Brassica carinata]